MNASFARAQASYDAMEDPRLAGPDCECPRWACPECGERYGDEGRCTAKDCEQEADEADTPTPRLVEVEESDLADAADRSCPAHRSACSCGYDHCPECG